MYVFLPLSEGVKGMCVAVDSCVMWTYEFHMYVFLPLSEGVKGMCVAVDSCVMWTYEFYSSAEMLACNRSQ